MALTQTDKIHLLQLARKVLEESFKDVSLMRNRWEWTEKFLPRFPVSDNSPAAVFITLKLKKSDNLRGCIGTIVPKLPLLSIIAKMTLQSAFHDPRFPPLDRSELTEVRIEISVLSPMQKVNDASQIVPNIHGVFVRKNHNSGLFLPQVWENLPDKEDFLDELCYSKAGLPLNAWKDPKTELYIFTVDHFEEKDSD